MQGQGVDVFVFLSAVTLAPVIGAVWVAGLLRRSDRLVDLAALAVVFGFIGSGLLGWAFVPAQWTASFWTTVDASVGAATSGAVSGHTAERALIWYFFVPAELGAIVSGLIALFVLWRIPVPPSAAP